MKQLNLKWLLRMAWRDSRKNRSRLLLFISSITIGIAALTAIFSLKDNVEKDLDAQAKILAGADLIIDSNRPLADSIQQRLDTMGIARAKESSFASMVYFTRSGGTRLVQVRALSDGFPFYGVLETSPAKAGAQFRRKRGALVDKTLMLQFNAQPGDSIQVGELMFEITGTLEQAPGRTGISTTVAPPVYIPYQYLEATGLMQKGSRVQYNFYYKFNNTASLDRELAQSNQWLDAAGLDYETAESRKSDTAREFNDLSEFLVLISFIALLLGCIGIASSVHIYVRGKIASIAMLRCIGASRAQTFVIYLIQVLFIGLLGAMAGAFMGTLIQKGLPILLRDVLPVALSTTISWSAVFKGIGIGVLVSLLFGMMPLLSIRNISPLLALRVSAGQKQAWRDGWQWLVYALVFLFITGFTWWQTGDGQQAIVFTISILGAFLLLVLLSMLLRGAVKRFLPSRLAYVWRQGFANLYRPNNQTLILMVTIGLGTAFIGTLYFVQGMLMNRVALSAGDNQPNIVLFDIQPDQKEAVAGIARQFNLPVEQQVPIVTTRIESVNGNSAVDAREDTSVQTPSRAFDGEIRVTYRDTLTDSEKIIEGELGTKVNNPEDPVYISIEDRYARRLRVSIGDSILFNVQGALIPTIVGSLREVDWRRVQTNFRVVFPPGVLETAPQFHVLITRVPSEEVSAQFQQAVVKEHPNVSIIDLGLILSVLDEVLEKIGFVIRFMAAFSMLTGLIVLIASVFTSKYQRMQESVLLRTLGASRKQLQLITGLEYFFLGSLAAATGLLLALAGSWALAKFSFDAGFAPDWGPALILFFSISIVTVVIGLFNSRSVVNQPPMEVLRRES